MVEDLTLPVFPLKNVVLFPRVLLPLHIFEPRYRKLIDDLMGMPKGKRLITISKINNQDAVEKSNYSFSDIATVGRLVHVEKLENGKSNIVLHGQYTAGIKEITPTPTPYRLCRITEIREEYWKNPLANDKKDEKKLMQAIKDFATRTKMSIEKIENIDLEDLINGFCFSLNFPVEKKQELLEESNLNKRMDKLIQLINSIGYFKEYKPPKREDGPIN